MEHDKEFFHWIMQGSPLNDPDVPYTSSQPQQLLTPQGNTTQHPFLAPPIIHSSPSSHYQHTYDERQSNQHSHFPDISQPKLYSLDNGSLPSTQRQLSLGPDHSHSSNHLLKLNGHNPQTSRTHRLSDEDEDHCTDAQLKMMTSKERRQLRNKISARKFRNRRKEYITSLEEEVDKFKNENCQLRLEINWVRSTMNKLQNENDRLRVKLALCHNGIETNEDIMPTSTPSSPTEQLSPILVPTTERTKLPSPLLKKNNANVLSTSVFSRNFLDQRNQTEPHLLSPSQVTTITPHTSTTLTSVQPQHFDLGTDVIATTLPPQQATVDSFNSNHMQSSSSLTSHLSKPIFTQSVHAWNMDTSSDPSSYHLPQQETAPSIIADMLKDTQQPNKTSIDRNNDSYIETAMFPDFSSGNEFFKQGAFDNSSQLFLDYPLLIVALMSIVISHTMSMTTKELLTHTQSAPVKPYNPSNEKYHQSLHHLPHDDLLTKKQVQTKWDALIDEMVKLQSDITRNNRQDQQVIESGSATLDVDNSGGDDPWYDAPVTGIKSICPLYWLQRKLCRFVITYVVVKYPYLEIPCKTYLPICEQFRRQMPQA